MEEQNKTVQVVDIQFRPGQKVYFFDPAGIACKAGDHVITDAPRTPENGDMIRIAGQENAYITAYISSDAVRGIYSGIGVVFHKNKAGSAALRSVRSGFLSVFCSFIAMYHPVRMFYSLALYTTIPELSSLLQKK